MLREDYLLTVIRRAAQVIARVLGLSEEKRYAQALEAVDHTLQGELGLSSALLAHLPESTLVDMMVVGGVVDVGRLLFVAEMLALEGDVYAAQGDEVASRQRRCKSLNLFLTSSRLAGASAPLELFARIESLAQQLRASGLPAETLEGLFRYFEAAGRYAKAEDALFDLIDASPRPEAAIAQGIAFYGRLQAKADAELEAADLSRSEVEDGLAELLAM